MKEPTKSFFNPKIEIYILPGGKMPERKSDGAIGYDAYLRAILSPSEIDLKNPQLRKILFDFKTQPRDPEVARHIFEVHGENGKKELVYRMSPHESVLGGLGFFTAMPFPLFYWMAPRSGLASRYGITVTNAPGTVDPDYRGEAGALIYNRNDKPFDLRHGFRIAQIVFQWAIIPRIKIVASPKKLASTTRGAGGFGSTGIR